MSAAQPSREAQLPPAAKKTKHDQPMSDADHSSSAKAAVGLGADADADSFSASYSTLQSPARTNSPNSWHKNLNGHVGVNSPQAGQHPHRAPKGTDSSQAGQHPDRAPVGSESLQAGQHPGQGDVALPGAALKAHNLPTQTEPSRDEVRPGSLLRRLKAAHPAMARPRELVQDQRAAHPVKQQRTASPSAPVSSLEQAQHIPACLSKQPSTTSAGLAAADHSRPFRTAAMAADRPDPEAHQAGHVSELAHEQAEQAQHAVSKATPTGPGSNEHTAREHDDQPSTAPPDEPGLSTQMGPAPVGLHALNHHPNLQQARPFHHPHTSYQSSSTHPAQDPQTQPTGLSSQPQQQARAPAPSTQAADLPATVQQYQHAPLAPSQAVKPPIPLNTGPTDPAGRTGIATKAAYAVGPDAADPTCSRGFAPQPAEAEIVCDQEAEASVGQSPKQESPEVVETVRAGDSDDDVEIMDDSPVRPRAHMLFSPSPVPLAGLSPQPEHPVPQHHYFDHQQQQKQPAEQYQQQAEQQQQQQQQEETDTQPPWQEADLSTLSNLASMLLAQHRQVQHPNIASTGVKQEARSSQSHDSAHMPGRQAAPTVAGSTSDHPVELSESDGGSKSGSDTSSDASSSVDPSQRVPAPWMHADTAASGQSRHHHMPQSGYSHAHGQMPQSGVSDAHGQMPQSGYTHAHGQMPQSGYSHAHGQMPQMPQSGVSHAHWQMPHSGDSGVYGLPARVMLRQQSQSSSPINGQLRTKR